MPGSLPPAVGVALPMAWPCSLRLDRDHETLVSVPVCDFIDKCRSPNCSTIDSNFVCSGVKQALNICNATDSASDSDRDEYSLGGALKEGLQLVSSVKGGDLVDVEKFVCTGGGVALSQYLRLTESPQPLESDSFDNVVSFDV